jgi:phage baseplate assembly protein W
MTNPVNYDLVSIKNRIRNLFDWQQGTRILYPEYGNILEKIKYEPLSELTMKNAESLIRKMFSFEPEVSITDIVITPNYDENTMEIRVDYEVPKLDVRSATIFSTGDDDRKTPISDQSNPANFTLAVIGDIQWMTRDAAAGDTTEIARFENMLNWISENEQKENIAAVLQLGDITENFASPTLGLDEFTFAAQYLDTPTIGNIPLSLGIGNHDYLGTPFMPTNDTTMYNNYFPDTTFNSQTWFGGQFEEGVHENFYYNIEKYGTNYLVINTEYGPRNEVINWCNDVIFENPDSKVVFISHAIVNDTEYEQRYLYASSAYFDENIYGLSARNNGQMIWDKLLKLHPNIVLTLCGHNQDQISTLTDTQSGIPSAIMLTKGVMDPIDYDFYDIYQGRPRYGTLFEGELIRAVQWTPSAVGAFGRWEIVSYTEGVSSLSEWNQIAASGTMPPKTGWLGGAPSYVISYDPRTSSTVMHIQNDYSKGDNNKRDAILLVRVNVTSGRASTSVYSPSIGYITDVGNENFTFDFIQL